MSTLTPDVASAPNDLPLDFGISIDAAEYAKIMRRIGTGDGTGTAVSAFNSSI